MDSLTSVIRDEAFVATSRPTEHHLWEHMPGISPCDGVVTGPLQDKIWIAMEWARLGGD
jgi:hypothetical protein